MRVDCQYLYSWIGSSHLKINIAPLLSRMHIRMNLENNLGRRIFIERSQEHTLETILIGLAESY